MIQRIHHINFIVRDLVSAIPAWERLLDRKVVSRDRLDARGVDVARFDLGQTWIILVQPTRPDTIPAAHLKRHGEGFFLMSLETDSLQEEVDRLGDGMFDGPARDGLEDWRVRDVSVAQMFGAQTQLVESDGS